MANIIKKAFILTGHDVSLNDFTTFVDTKRAALTVPSEPAACIPAARLFGGLEGRFGRGMRNSPARVNGLLYGLFRRPGGPVITGRPDIVRDFRRRWGNKNGLMWIHEPKDNIYLCQTVAGAGV